MDCIVVWVLGDCVGHKTLICTVWWPMEGIGSLLCSHWSHNENPAWRPQLAWLGWPRVSRCVTATFGGSLTSHNDSSFTLISWWRCWKWPGNLQLSKTNYLTSCCGISSSGWTVTKFCHLSSLSIGGCRFEKWPRESFFFLLLLFKSSLF